MKSVTLTPVVSAPVRISSSCRAVARMLKRLVLIVRREFAVGIVVSLIVVRTVYANRPGTIKRGMVGKGSIREIPVAKAGL